MKLVNESFDEMDAAYEVASRIMKKYGRNPSSENVRKEIDAWLKDSGWEGDLDPQWIYNFVMEDVADEIGLFESKKLDEALSTDKEAFLVLDKLAGDLKKVYDEDGKGYKIHEQQKLNDATNDLIELQIDFVIIKELLHYVAQNVYERKYSQEELLKKLEQVKFKYSNILKTDEDDKKTESLKSLKEEVSSSRELCDVLDKLKDAGYLSFDAKIQMNNGLVYVTYDGLDINMEPVDARELRQRYKHDLNFLKQYHADIEEEETGYDKDLNNYTIGIYYEI